MPVEWLSQPERWLARFAGTAQPGEFYVFQLGVWAGEQGLEEVTLEFGTLSALRGAHSGAGLPPGRCDRGEGTPAPVEVGSSAGEFPATACRCFNLGGIDFMGQPLKKTVAVPAGNLQALWIGVDVPVSAAGRYEGTVKVGARGVPATAVKVALEVKGKLLRDHGDADAARLARLRWLDSMIGFDDWFR